MSIEEIKHKITELAKKHHAIDMPTIDEIDCAEILEKEATTLIIAYCEQHGYTINGFPIAKRKLFKEQEIVDDEEEFEYFSQERFQLYLDHLALEKDDVAELLWFYNKSFWPDFAKSKNEFLKLIKEQIECGFYDIEL